MACRLDPPPRLYAAESAHRDRSVPPPAPQRPRPERGDLRCAPAPTPLPFVPAQPAPHSPGCARLAQPLQPPPPRARFENDWQLTQSPCRLQPPPQEPAGACSPAALPTLQKTLQLELQRAAEGIYRSYCGLADARRT